MKVDYLITNGFFSNYCKKQVPGIQNKTNNIKIDSENKSILSYKERTKQHYFFNDKTENKYFK